MMNGAKAIMKKYNEVSLILRIVVGLVIGAVLALAVPGAGWVGELGSLFVGALKGIAPVLVFVIVASALAQGSSKLDRRFGTVIWLYMLTTCSLCRSFWQTLPSRTWCRRVWARC